MRFTPINSRRFAGILLLFVGLIGCYAASTYAQDEPTDRPFPAIATRTPVPAPTDRPFPEATAAVQSSEETAEATVEATTPLTIDSAIATAAAAQSEADQLRTENKTLQDQLASSQVDNGATLYAVVIVVIGILLALAVFFGLRRSDR